MANGRKWKLSLYTSVVRDDSGDLLLHNSFMGAIARIPAQQSQTIEKFLQPGFEKYRKGSTEPEVDEPDSSDPVLTELCGGGFFVPAHLDERKLASETIDKERESGFGIIILPHENCNFRCVYCYETFERGKMKPDVVAGLKAFVDRKAKETGSLSTSWFGGEPLLGRDVIYELSDSFIDSCEQNSISYTSSMTTNGYFLTPNVVDSLLQRKVNHYQVTLDGPEASHNSTRKLAGGQGTYRKILDNLAAMRDRDDKFLVRIRVNFDNTNHQFMDHFFDEITPLFKGDPRFNLDFHAVGKWGGPNDSVLDVCDADSAQTVRLSLIKKSLKLGFTDRMVKDSLMSHGSICYAGKENSIVVRTDGVICKCTVAFEDPRNHVGRLTKEGELLINHARWDLWTKLDDKNAGKCTSCSFSPSCQSRACPLVAIDQKEPPCPMTRTEYESMVKLVAVGSQVGGPPCAHVLEPIDVVT
jgi:uncharacterized protein